MRILTSSYAVILLGVLHQRVTEAGRDQRFLSSPPGIALCPCLPCQRTLEPLRSIWLCLAGFPILGWDICMKLAWVQISNTDQTERLGVLCSEPEKGSGE